MWYVILSLALKVLWCLKLNEKCCTTALQFDIMRENQLCVLTRLSRIVIYTSLLFQGFFLFVKFLCLSNTLNIISL